MNPKVQPLFETILHHSWPLKSILLLKKINIAGYTNHTTAMIECQMLPTPPVTFCYGNYKVLQTAWKSKPSALFDCMPQQLTWLTDSWQRHSLELHRQTTSVKLIVWTVQTPSCCSASHLPESVLTTIPTHKGQDKGEGEQEEEQEENTTEKKEDQLNSIPREQFPPAQCHVWHGLAEAHGCDWSSTVTPDCALTSTAHWSCEETQVMQPSLPVQLQT